MLSTVLSFLESFQAAIVGIVGFWGVNKTLKANANLANEQRRLDEEQKAKFVRRAILADLRLFKGVFARNEGSWSAGETGSILVPRIERVASKAIMNDIGVLSLPEIEVSLDALLTIDELDRSLTLFSSKIDELYLTISSKHAVPLEEMRGSLHAKVIHAITQIEKFDIE